MERSRLIRALKAVMPAVNPKSGISAFHNVFFQKGKVTAYDDQLAIEAPCALEEDLDCGLDAKSLVAWLGSGSGEEVSISLLNKYKGSFEGRAANFKSGRAKLDLPVAGIDEFAWKEPEDTGVLEIMAPDDLVAGLSKVLPVITESGTPWYNVVYLTVKAKENKGIIMGTDGRRLARASCGVDVGEDRESSLSLRFAQQVVSKAKDALVDVIRLGKDWTEASFDDGVRLWSRVPVGSDFGPKSMDTVIDNLLSENLPMAPVPERFGEALDRCGIVAGEVVCTNAMIKDEVMYLEATSLSGKVEDDLEFKGPDGEYSFNPFFVQSCLESCSHMAFNPGASVFFTGENDFVFVVSLVTSS